MNNIQKVKSETEILSNPKGYNLSDIRPPYMPGKETVDVLGRSPIPSLESLLQAAEFYNRGDYKEAEYYVKEALIGSRMLWVHRLAHRWLALIYETGGQPDLAIKELDWLLKYSNKYTKPDLLKWKIRLETDR